LRKLPNCSYKKLNKDLNVKLQGLKYNLENIWWFFVKIPLHGKIRVLQVLTSMLGKRAMEREASVGVFLFIGEGERGAVPVLHVGERQVIAHRNDWIVACIRFPCLGLVTGGPWSGFETWHEPEGVRDALFISPAR
jgi:hypothetical protein